MSSRHRRVRAAWRVWCGAGAGVVRADVAALLVAFHIEFGQQK